MKCVGTSDYLRQARFGRRGQLGGRRVVGLQVAQGPLDARQVMREHGLVPIDFLVVAQGAVKDAALAAALDPGDGVVIILAAAPGLALLLAQF